MGDNLRILTVNGFLWGQFCRKPWLFTSKYEDFLQSFHSSNSERKTTSWIRGPFWSISTAGKKHPKYGGYMLVCMIYLMCAIILEASSLVLLHRIGRWFPIINYAGTNAAMWCLLQLSQQSSDDVASLEKMGGACVRTSGCALGGAARNGTVVMSMKLTKTYKNTCKILITSPSASPKSVNHNS